jgi:hypothetical protein
MTFIAPMLRRLLKREGQPTHRAPLEIHELLGRGRVGVLSAACCDASSAARDEQLQANLASALQKTGSRQRPVHSTLTVARHQLRELGTQVDGPVAAFRDDLATLFQTRGLAAFPLLIVDGRIAFYGGVPSTEIIELKLLSQPGSEQVRSP